MFFIRIFFLIVLFIICGIQVAQAEETDQFTLPPYELQDIGPSSSNNLYRVLEKIIAQTNSEIQMLLPRAKHSRIAAAKLASKRRDSYIADLVYKNTGPGFPRWMRWNLLPKGEHPIQYKETWPWNNVYWLSFSQSPLSLIGLVPTINMYGYYFGTDKLGHFFMQGHTYYTLYTYLLNHGKSAEQAHKALVIYGKILEQTYLGTLVNGIYSNGDLSANYAGWKFYMNLGHSVKIGDKMIPPILVLNGNKWEFSKHITRDNLLKPYISDNLNEALNPCRYSFTRRQIRKQIKKRCASWVERYGITQQFVEGKLKETSRWHGEDYGHWLPASNQVTLNVCFGGK